MIDPSVPILGIQLAYLAAGFSGGMVVALVLGKIDPVALLSSVVIGSLTSAYLTDAALPILTKYVGTSNTGAAFIVGVLGSPICQGIISASKRFRISSGEGNVLKQPDESRGH